MLGHTLQQIYERTFNVHELIINILFISSHLHATGLPVISSCTVAPDVNWRYVTPSTQVFVGAPVIEAIFLSILPQAERQIESMNVVNIIFIGVSPIAISEFDSGGYLITLII